MKTPVLCPICQTEGRTSCARQIGYDEEKRVGTFQCFENPAHTFKESLDKNAAAK